jgi:hypothetical protein
MCPVSDGFLERRRVNSPYEYHDLVVQTLATAAQETFVVLSGTCPPEEILPSKRWPGELVVVYYDRSALHHKLRVL